MAELTSLPSQPPSPWNHPEGTGLPRVTTRGANKFARPDEAGEGSLGLREEAGELTAGPVTGTGK